MILIRRQNKKPDYDGKPVVCAYDTISQTILKSWPNQAAITDEDLQKLVNFQVVNSLLQQTANRLLAFAPV